MSSEPDVLASSPVFEPLRAHAGALLDGARPDPASLQRLIEARVPPVRTAAGLPLRIVEQGRKPRAFEEKYEPRLFLKGELQVRRDSWHDCFNALVWLAFPVTKAALNARHYAALLEQHAARRPNRGAQQDTLTLFDEGGVIVASQDEDLLQMVREFRWKDLFWRNRARLARRMHFAVFGHALYEKALRPFPGVTGRAILLRAAPALLSAPAAERVAALDAQVAALVADPRRLLATRELEVLPLWGVPGWSAGNERESFYDDTAYFRPGRRLEA